MSRAVSTISTAPAPHAPGGEPMSIVFIGLTQRWGDPTVPALWDISRAALYQALIDPKR